MQDLSRHLKEAIELNEERLNLYAKLTEGKSRPFSKKLISHEKLILKTSWILDRIGDKYQNKGVPFMKYEFVDMSEARPFSNTFPPEINFSVPIKILETKDLLQNLKSITGKTSSSEIIKFCNQVLKILDEQPQYYNMLRHIIESIRRISYLMPLHQKLCESKNIKPPSFYSKLLIKSHQFLLDTGKTFDERIAFIQESGVPFLWQDLPPIPLNNFEYK